jgi:hypothetical protein
MCAEGPATTLEEIASALQERRSTRKYVTLFLGARAGEFFANEDFCQALKKHIPEFDSLSEMEGFGRCYEVLGQRYSDTDRHEILINSLKERKYRQEDEALVHLLQAGFSNLIITTHIGPFIENAFIPTNMQEPEDYKIIIPEKDGSAEIFSSPPKYGRLIKVYGDLTAQQYRTSGRAFDLKADRALEYFLKQELQKDVLVIGYDSIWDQGIEQAFSSSGGMIWYINGTAPEKDSHLARVIQERKGKYLLGEQGQYTYFIRALYDLIGPGIGQSSSGRAFAVTSTQPKPHKKAFISYSRKDKEYLDRLLVHFKGLLHYQHFRDVDDYLNVVDDRTQASVEEQGLDKESIWHDRMIRSGELWREKIETAMRDATVVVVLVSADFLASDFIREHELPILLEAAEAKRVTLLPVMLSPCGVRHTGLARYQMINDISRPLVKMSYYEREEIWSNLVERIFDLLTAP